MPKIELTGLDGAKPMGFMAALGAWRTAARFEPRATLAWVDRQGVFVPVLGLGPEQTPEDLAARFAEEVRNWPERPELSWSDAIKKATGDEFRDVAARALGTDHEDWFAAFGSELIIDDDKVEPTPFDMSVARQLFLADALWLHEELKTFAQQAFQEALFGPWKYEDSQHHLGWDSTTMLLGAFTPKAPTSMKKAGVRAAVWLAMESIPLFPCFCRNGRFAVRGFQVKPRNRWWFQWPLWSASIPLRIAPTVLGLESLEDRAAMSARGVLAVFRSQQFKPNKYLSSFQPAERLW